MLPMKKIKPFLFLSIVSLMTMLISACNTSPLFQAIGFDSGIFLTIGKSVVDGHPLYLGLFDHKGPFIFLLNALPQFFIKGTLGVWLLEFIFMTLSMFILYKMATLLLPPRHALFIPLAYLALMIAVLEDGNFTEEYCNLFCIISLYIWANFIQSEHRTIRLRECTILGISLTFVIFTRPNNAALIAAVILHIGIYTLIYKKEKAIFYILYGFLGMLFVTVPLFAYLISQGNLSEMFYALFAFNVKYSDSTSLYSMLQDKEVIKYFFLPFVILYAIIAAGFIYAVLSKKTAYSIFLLLAGALSFISITFSGNAYKHYLMIAVPLAALSLCLILPAPIKPLQYLLQHLFKTCLCLSITFILFVSIHGLRSLEINRYPAYIGESKSLAESIPADERHQVFGYNQDSRWFYICGITPYYRYFTLQDWWISKSPELADTLNHDITLDPPLWIITPDINGIQNNVIQDFITERYTLMTSNPSGSLYRYQEH